MAPLIVRDFNGNTEGSSRLVTCSVSVGAFF
jgi:hypothetical protein